MSTTAFVYVDTAVNGAFNRNRVMRLADFAAAIGAIDVYTTYFRYTANCLSMPPITRLLRRKSGRASRGFAGRHSRRFFPPTSIARRI